MKEMFRTVPVLLLTLPMLAFADHSAPIGATIPEPSTESEHVCAFESNLTVGSRGTAVTCLQNHLIAGGYLQLPASTGYFGEMTKSAVAKWQKEKGIAATGFFGSLSREEYSGHHEEAQPVMAEAMHAHLPVDVAQWPAVPSVSIKLHPDSMSGWNLEATTTHFRFAPEHVNGVVLANEGHMHLYIDGKKIGRVYGNWYHLPKELFVGAGPHTVVVTLNANDHSDLSFGGSRVEAKSEILTN